MPTDKIGYILLTQIDADGSDPRRIGVCLRDVACFHEEKLGTYIDLVRDGTFYRSILATCKFDSFVKLLEEGPG